MRGSAALGLMVASIGGPLPNIQYARASPGSYPVVFWGPKTPRHCRTLKRKPKKGKTRRQRRMESKK